MKPVRAAARAMLGAIFVVSGARIVLNPDSKVATAKRVTDKVGPMIEKLDPRLPSDARALVRLKAGSDVAAGLLLATGRFTRPAAAVLAAGLVPTTVAGHSFWTMPQPEREQHQIHFLKNLGLLGGLLLAAVDTQGKPGLKYRTTHAIGRSQRSVSHAVERSQRSARRAMRTARREAKIAALSATAARKLPG
ncbi:DoxX family protein [Couchioplanes caeruleus]|uniref:DoxX family protein n=2 Tax=Couchioplanes caeruleus TaxID=56438 RepID=A0A1K0GHA3_9ACTN|nr:DoxX family protein [Couchioplanes caeruleus]OJF11614.1 DoxX family protein [Couchioplanes caeruleus subsp. caeruleus]ROP31160.1 putative membrane protein YphA (DoxX/SURF4 family) [Couchioplanes caeruleus]